MGDDPLDLLILGRVATLGGTSGFGWVDVLGIRGGRVMATGSVADVEPLAGARTRRWRLPADQLVMPTLTDAHLHLEAAALAAAQPDLMGLDEGSALAAIAAAHHELAAAGDDDGWLLGHGWSVATLGAAPTAAWLDAVAPGRPVALWSHDHHSRWLSSAAIDRADLASRADPTGGRIARDAHGRASGLAWEAAAGLVDAAIPAPEPRAIEAAIIAYAAVLAALGVTSVHDPGGLAPDPGLHGGPVRYEAMAASGRLPLRVTASVRVEQLGRAIGIGFRSGREGAERYHDGWLKVFADGALGSRTAALLEPYAPDDPAGPPPGGPAGMLLRSTDELAGLVGRAAGAGIASQIHAIGDAAVRTVLDVLAAAPVVAGAQHRVEHAQLVAPADAGRFGELGVAASVQPCHLLSDAAGMRVAWGPRIAMAFPLAAMDAAGALLPFGTDAPVEQPDPWPGIAAAVTRRGPGWAATDAVHPGHALSLERALRAACLDGPRSAGRADEGHLGIGARADLIVVPAQLVDTPPDPDTIGTLRPLATVLDGEVAWSGPDFDP